MVGRFRASVTFFEPLGAQESHRQQTGATSVASWGTGGDSIDNNSSSRPNQTDHKNKKHDKYFYFDFVENVTDYFENFGEAMKLRFFEYIDEDISSRIKGTIKGSLKHNLDYWRSISASKFVLDTTEFLYKIPFYETPEESF